MAKIKRFGVLKMASFLGLYGLFLGLVFAILGFLGTLVISSSALDLIGGGLSLFLLPLLYGVMGFVGGLIFTPIMNLSLRIVKGLNLDLETKEETIQNETQPTQTQ
jgi:hypothetical protein